MKRKGIHLAKAARFAARYGVLLIQANLQTARAILLGRSALSPDIVEVPTSLGTETRVAILANLITLTPATLSIDVPDDLSRIRVHGLFAGREAVRAEIERDLARPLEEVFR